MGDQDKCKDYQKKDGQFIQMKTVQERIDGSSERQAEWNTEYLKVGNTNGIQGRDDEIK